MALHGWLGGGCSFTGLRGGTCQWPNEQVAPVAVASRLCSRGAGLSMAVACSRRTAEPVPRGLHHAASLVCGCQRDTAAVTELTITSAATHRSVLGPTSHREHASQLAPVSSGPL